MKNYWLFKSEPKTYSILDLEKDGQTFWEGVRNYQARNFLKNQVGMGDYVLFYHSNCSPPGIFGIAKVCKTGYPDRFALDKTNKYFDPKATKDNPIWYMVDIAFVEKFKNPISLHKIKTYPKLKNMFLVKKGMRLSIQPVLKKEFDYIVYLSKTLEPPIIK